MAHLSPRAPGLSLFLLSLLLLLLLGQSTTAAAAKQPNLIFLILDDMDSMLNATDVMPHYVQRFSKEGMFFPNAFVASPKCCPSRTSLLAGRFSHGLNDTAQGWCGNFISAGTWNNTWLASVKGAGYTTGFFGKMVNMMGPMCDAKRPVVPQGYDVKSGDRFVAMCNEVVYYENTFNIDGALATTGKRGNASAYLTAFLGNHTLDWLNRVAPAAAAPGGPPFFAYVSPHAPHFPAEPAPWYSDAPLPSDTAPRPPAYDSFREGKSWAIRENPPLPPFTQAGIDLHFRNRQRTLMSVDDTVRDVFGALEAAGVLDNTYVIATSDHGYHLGEYGIPFEKSTPYVTDTNVPFYVRGPGVPAGGVAEGMVSLMDIGATLMELAGVGGGAQSAQGGQVARTTDGRSLVPLLSASGAPPAGWRNGVLIEHLGENNQWMSICGWVFNASCPAKPAAKDPLFLIDGPQNTWAQWRVVNATHNFAYVEFRDIKDSPSPQSTNWTELYDTNADPWQGNNLATSGPIPAYANELWQYATCEKSSCP